MNANTLTRSEWIRYPLVALLASAGLGGGLYLSGLTTPRIPIDQPDKAFIHRLPLSAFDVKERNEAPELAVDAKGRVYLAWASQTAPEERTLFLTSSDDTGRTFATPRGIARSGIFKAVSQMRGKTITRELKMTPHVAVHAGTVHLAWNEALPNNTGVRMVTAESTDQGATFGTPLQVHQGEGARTAFTGFAVGSDGALLCSWLDNRNKSPQSFASLKRAGAKEFDGEELVHAGDETRGVCPCCPTACLIGPDGTCFVAFRNVEDGYRDIAIGRKKPGQSAFELFPVVPPTWIFNGCPHDGPSLALVGDTLHVTWMDAHIGPQRCYHGQASLADMKFTTQELHKIAAGTQGNARLFADATGAVHAVWEESLGASADDGAGAMQEHAAPTIGAGGGRVIRYASLTPGARTFADVRAVAAKAGAFQTRPNLAGTRDGRIMVAYNELDEAGKAVVVVTFDPKKRADR